LADKVEVVRLGLDCSPCFDRTCRFGHYNCLRQLLPDAVAEALQRLQGNVVEVH
jgi:heptosyltransferase II